MSRRDAAKAGAGGGIPLELYVHIPFCMRKCLYCDFLSASAPPETVARYVDALCAQIRFCGGFFSDRPVRTVYLGGGTPSLLSPGQISAFFQALFDSFSIVPGAEITLEANPGTLSGEKLSDMRSLGINRLSIGLQSADDGELRRLGRIHTWGQFLESYDAARRAGFDNVNVDLMSGLPGQSLESWEHTLGAVTALAPEHISAYGLMIEEGTPFYERYGDRGEGRSCQRGERMEVPLAGMKTEDPWPPLPDEETECGMDDSTRRILADAGYRRYEISNYARPGRECAHNVGYWRRREYLGLGLGSASLMGNVRFRMRPDLEGYLRAAAATGTRRRPADAAPSSGGALEDFLSAAKDCLVDTERLTLREQMEEFLFLGLRMTEGVLAGEFQTAFRQDLFAVYGSAIDKLAGQGLLLLEPAVGSGSRGDTRLRLSERGLAVSNVALAEFL